MTALPGHFLRAPQGRRRQLLTAEGLTLPITLASRSARAGALLLDLAIVALGLLVLMTGAGLLGIRLAEVDSPSAQPVIEGFAVIAILILFLARYGYFLWFELGPRGATPGKRLLGLRVAARPFGERGEDRLTAEMVIARNLMRDAEVFVPLTFLLSGGAQAGLAGLAAMGWLALFVAIPLINRDGLRAGDIVAGTWVVENARPRLPAALSLDPPREAQYRFGEAELAVYGEHELQVLEDVLRREDEAAMHEVARSICRKIGWEAGAGDEREFLEAYYAALRAHLEGAMRFGRRKANKFAR